MLMYKFRKAPYLENKEIKKLLSRYKKRDNYVFANTGFYYGGENWMNAILNKTKIDKKDTTWEEISFWQFDELTTKPFWKTAPQTSYEKQQLPSVPFKHIIYGVIIVDKKEWELDEITDFTIKVV